MCRRSSAHGDLLRGWECIDPQQTHAMPERRVVNLVADCRFKPVGPPRVLLHELDYGTPAAHLDSGRQG
jgi:hypothetical protein